MSDLIPNGVWPTMLTPFTDDYEIDYEALERLIVWYLGHGVAGLFATCQSSEMFYLSLAERQALTSFVQQQVQQQAQERVPVVASGHISDNIEEQLTELKTVADTGVAAVVLVTNRLAAADESESIWQRNAEIILNALPNTPFGLYECPQPYKRLLSPDLLRWCAQTGRFFFLKDTCCDIPQLEAKAAVVAGSSLKLFNADEPTLLGSLPLGIAGYSGIMANFHPQFYVWLLKNWAQEPQKAQDLHQFLSEAKESIKNLYPLNAKYYLTVEGIINGFQSRTKNMADLAEFDQIVIQELTMRTRSYTAQYLS